MDRFCRPLVEELERIESPSGLSVLGGASGSAISLPDTRPDSVASISFMDIALEHNERKKNDSVDRNILQYLNDSVENAGPKSGCQATVRL